MSELCHHTLHPPFWKTGHCQIVILRSEWGGKACENIQWVPEYLVLLPGLRESAPGELTSKGKVPKGRVGNTANNPALWWPLPGSKWRWEVLAPGLSTAARSSVLALSNNCQTPMLPLPSTGIWAEAEGMEGSRCWARVTTGGKVAVIGAFGKSHFRELRWLSCLVTFYLFIYYSEGLFAIPSVFLWDDWISHSLGIYGKSAPCCKTKGGTCFS